MFFEVWKSVLGATTLTKTEWTVRDINESTGDVDTKQETLRVPRSPWGSDVVTRHPLVERRPNSVRL